MKKIFTFLVIASFATITTVSAQSKKIIDGVKFGVKAGINVTNEKLSPEEEPPSSSLIGLTAGVFATVPISNGFAIQPELSYSAVGYQLKENTGNTRNIFNYIVLPVLAKYSFTNSGFAVYAGPQIGVLLSAKQKVGGGVADIKQYFKGTDFDAIFGVEYTLPVSVIFSARYQLGLANNYKFAAGSSGGGSIKNNAFTITAGYVFNKK
jgi:hypothetical protein